MSSTTPFENLIASVWAEHGAWPEIIGHMRSALSAHHLAPEAGQKSPALWAFKLPGLCCAALGGSTVQADRVAAAWYLLYTSAHILDNVEDQDAPEVWWEDLGPGPAVNVATAMIFTASLLLDGLDEEVAGVAASREISREFYRQMLVIGSGQHLDLTLDELTIAEWWRIAEAKAGSAFSLGCWAGARLVSDDRTSLESMRRYGHHLGLMIQVLDDAKDFLSEGPFTRSAAGQGLGWSLPVVYAMEVLPTGERARLQELLAAFESGAGASDRLVEIIRSSGVDLYLQTHLQQHRRAALDAVKAAAPATSARKQLIELIDLLLPA